MGRTFQILLCGVLVMLGGCGTGSQSPSTVESSVSTVAPSASPRTYSEAEWALAQERGDRWLHYWKFDATLKALRKRFLAQKNLKFGKGPLHDIVQKRKMIEAAISEKIGAEQFLPPSQLKPGEWLVYSKTRVKTDGPILYVFGKEPPGSSKL